ncbi:hypothetical protein MBM_06915 [Drepanopeziza brunnea f. sp. 'multigermtubi' MB_m1]|uniref:Glucose receptor Git3-like N-terminal domain-containing protein n=1 Tax=Marssonina brunnea f. sp. multigermtubi (strain MB_m1) TaxID=1072389 RepID=K1XQ79_MARBU|nr:uncharacterized protein MBM_06915 [Drepanopeziza brunnea f. sp. 'multigermtubi' MB_m1]EKD14704.1 hypothetical protein MBM_06915 [Drepanopeziza brunnea f. sp. 'multigermtubi' MB_m1]
MVDFAAAIPTLVGSYLSAIAAASVIICYFVLSPSQKHFRHTLILNLASADLINALNNSISGSYVMVHRQIPAGRACTINGWVGQLTVQVGSPRRPGQDALADAQEATDFSILFMTIATVVTLKKWNYEPKIGPFGKLFLTVGIWLVPSVTSSTGYFLEGYKPVKGNWCWLSASRNDLRYSLGHGWRITIILTVIALYVYLFTFIHRHFTALRSISTPDKGASGGVGDRSNRQVSGAESDKIHIHSEFVVYEEFDGPQVSVTELDLLESPGLSSQTTLGQVIDSKEELVSPIRVRAFEEQKGPTAGITELPLSPFQAIQNNFHQQSADHTIFTNVTHLNPHEMVPCLKSRDPLAIVRRPPPVNMITIQSTHAAKAALWTREKQIYKLLLFNAYPIAYVLLWLPGLANRLAEMLGERSRELVILQGSTHGILVQRAHMDSLQKLVEEEEKSRSEGSIRILGFRRRRAAALGVNIVDNPPRGATSRAVFS